jgi:hypothetical protein
MRWLGRILYVLRPLRVTLAKESNFHSITGAGANCDTAYHVSNDDQVIRSCNQNDVGASVTTTFQSPH